MVVHCCVFTTLYYKNQVHIHIAKTKKFRIKIHKKAFNKKLLVNSILSFFCFGVYFILFI